MPDAVAVVQLVHGIGEHIGRYDALIEALNGAGYSVWADDHRGHGKTGFEQHGGDLDRMGLPGPGGMRASIAAVGQFSEVIRAAEGADVPLVILGHSWGSFIAQHLVNRHPDRYDAVVLTGSAWLQLGWTNTGDLNKRFARPGGTAMEWISRDPAVPCGLRGRPLHDEPHDAAALRLAAVAVAHHPAVQAHPERAAAAAPGGLRRCGGR